MFALRCELGLYIEAEDTGAPTGDSTDEEILWHLGIGEARKERREMQPTADNVRKLEEKRRQVRCRFHALCLAVAAAADEKSDLAAARGREGFAERDDPNDVRQAVPALEPARRHRGRDGRLCQQAHGLDTRRRHRRESARPLR